MATIEYRILCLLYDHIGISLIASLVRFYSIFYISLVRELLGQSFQMLFGRIFLYLALFLIVPFLMVWTHFCFILDDIFYPQWKLQATPTVFIVGNGCSGGDLLYEALTEDELKYTFVRTWEVLVGSSVTARRMMLDIYFADKRMGGHIFGVMCDLENWLMRSQNGYKECLENEILGLSLGLQQPIQDDWLLIHFGLCRGLLPLLPFSSPLLNPVNIFNAALVGIHSEYCLSETARENISICYKQMIQRHLYGRKLNYGEWAFIRSLHPMKPRHMVSFNPSYSFRLPSLITHFPGVRIICMIRDPMYTIPALVQQQTRFDRSIGLHPNLLRARRNRLPMTEREAIGEKENNIHQDNMIEQFGLDILKLARSSYNIPIETLTPAHIKKKQYTFLYYHSLQLSFWSALYTALTKIGLEVTRSIKASSIESKINPKLHHKHDSQSWFMTSENVQNTYSFRDKIIKDYCGLSLYELKTPFAEAYKAYEFKTECNDEHCYEKY